MKELTHVTLPTIHLNGTGAANLEAEYQAVQQAVRAAENLLQAATCNQRDFYPQEPDAWQRAQDERAEAFRLLQLVSNYVDQWEIHALREQCIRRRERARTIAMLDHAEARDRHRDHSRDDD